jgi:putative transposase
MNIHLVYSTKHREPVIGDIIRDELHAYMATVLKNMGCMPLLINSVEDHAHHLFDLGRTLSISQVVEELKTSSSKWIKTKGHQFANFAWQSGYGAFAVSESNIEIVRQYIEKQREHHRHKSFQDEYRQFLERHDIKFDERYMWD